MLDDLIAYVNCDVTDPVSQAATAHAQFEIIHPFADGNGRVGRVLVAWILVRRLSLVTPPPVSARIAADVGGYGSGLVLFRMGDHNAWVRWFAEAVSGAARAQQGLVASVERLQREWRERLAGPRKSRRVRSDAAAWRVLDLLPRHLVLTGPIVASKLAIPLKSANAALSQLVDAGVLVEHGTVQGNGRGRPSLSTRARSCSASPGRTRCGPEPGKRSRRLFFRHPMLSAWIPSTKRSLSGFSSTSGSRRRGIFRTVVGAARYRRAMRRALRDSEHRRPRRSQLDLSPPV